MAYWGSRFTPLGVIAVIQGYRNFNNTLNAMQRDVSGFGAGIPAVAQPFVGLGNTVISTTARMALLAGAALTGLSMAVGALGVAAIGASRDYESAFAGVLKTTEGLEDASGNLNVAGQELRRGFRDLSLDIPTTASDLADIGAIAGQLGVEFSESDKSMLPFVRTVANLGVTTNLTAEDGAFALARFANVFGIEVADMGANAEHVGSTIVDLGNNFATTEKDIINFATRVGGAGKITGFTQADVLGIAAAMSSLGVQSEAGGTATQKTMLAINTAVAGAGGGVADYSDKIDKNIKKLTDLNAALVKYEAKTGMSADALWGQYEAFLAAGGSVEEFGRQLGDTNRFQLFKTIRTIKDLTEETDLLREEQGKPVDSTVMTKIAELSGLSVEEFKDLWETDASEAFKLFVRGIAQQGDKAALVFKDLKLNNERLIRAFLSLSGAGDLLDRTLDRANTGWEENSALTIEAEKRYRTTDSRIQIFKNTVTDLAITIGDYLLPTIADLLGIFRPLLKNLGTSLPGIMENKVIPAIEGFIAGLKTLIDTLSNEGLKGVLKKMGFSDVELEFLGRVKDGMIAATTDIIEAVGNVMDWFSTEVVPRLDKALTFLLENWGLVKGAVIGIAAVIGGSVVLAAINAFILAITGIGPIVIAVMVAAAALSAAWQTNFGDIQGITERVWNRIQPILNILRLAFELHLPRAIAFFKPTWDKMVGAFGEALDELSPLREELDKFLPTLGKLAAFLIGSLGAALRILGEVFTILAAPTVRIGVLLLTMMLRTITNVVNGLIGLKNMIVGVFTGNKDLVDQGMKEVSDAVFKHIEDIKVFITGLSDTLFGVFEDVFSRLGIDIRQVTADIGMFIRNTASSISAFASSLATDFVAKVNEGIGTVVTFFTNLWTSISTGATNAGAAIRRFLEPAIPLFTEMARLVGLVDRLWAAMSNLLLSAGRVAFMFIIAAITKADTWLKTMTGTLTGPLDTAINNFVTTNGPNLSTAFTDIYNAVKPVNDAIESIKTLIGDTIIAAISSFVDKIKGDFTNALNTLVGDKGLLTSLTTVLKSINDFIEKVITKLGEFSTALNSITLPEWLVGHSPSPLEKTLAGVAEEFADASDATEEFGRALENELPSDLLYGPGARIAAGLADGIRSRKSDVVEAAQTLGQSVGDGIVQGINDTMDAVAAAATGMVNVAHQSAQIVLLADSPSGLFIPLGESIPQGLAAGISSAASEVTSALSEVLDVNDFVNALINNLSSVKVELTSDIKDMFSDTFKTAWGDLKHILGGSAPNIRSMFQEWMDKWMDAASIMPGETIGDVLDRMLDAAAAIVPGGGAQIISALRDLWQDVLEDQSDALAGFESAMAESLLDIASSLSSFASAAVTRLRELMLDPIDEAINSLQASMDEATSEIDNINRLIAMIQNRRNPELAVQTDEERISSIASEMETLDEEIANAQLRKDLGLGTDEDLNALLSHRQALMSEESTILQGLIDKRQQAEEEQKKREEERNALLRQQQAIQEKLLALQQAQSDLQWLQARADLMSMITEHGLNAQEILGGLVLGVGANLNDIIEAMTRAMNAIIAQAQETLGIHSESTVFAHIGEMLMGGLKKGIGIGAKTLGIRSSMQAVTSVSTTPANVNTRSLSVPITMHINNGMDQAVAELWIRNIVSQEVG